MAVQTKILKRTETIEYKTADGGTTTVQLGTGTLIGGTPGQIYDVAYGPVVHTTTLTEAAKIGSFLPGQGIIVNAPEYALYGVQGNPLAPTLELPKGSVVSCMTAGHVWMTASAFEEIGDAANAYIIWAETDKSGDSDSSDDGDDLVVVEINGLKAYGPDSSDNG